MSDEFEPAPSPWQYWRPANDPQKKSYWRSRAEGAWPGHQIWGTGPFVFVSHCMRVVMLFENADEARAARCVAVNCDPIRGHERVKIKWLPPIRIPGEWED
jgi:hypothetical protein